MSELAPPPIAHGPPGPGGSGPSPRAWAPGATLVTRSLVVFNVLVHVAGSWFPGWPGSGWILELGSKSNDLIWSGEYWRLITPVFLHAGLAHLLFNQTTLWLFGRPLESTVGPVRFLTIYVMSGIMGVTAAFCFHEHPSVGSSGAVLGILAALLVTGTRIGMRPDGRSRDPVETASTLVWLVILAAASTGPGRTDGWAHLGGLVGGSLGGLTGREGGGGGAGVAAGPW